MRIEPAYRPLLKHHAKVSATVFLTNTQRADAELEYGRQPKFFGSSRWLVVISA